MKGGNNGRNEMKLVSFEAGGGACPIIPLRTVYSGSHINDKKKAYSLLWYANNKKGLSTKATTWWVLFEQKRGSAGGYMDYLIEIGETHHHPKSSCSVLVFFLTFPSSQRDLGVVNSLCLGRGLSPVVRLDEGGQARAEEKHEGQDRVGDPVITRGT